MNTKTNVHTGVIINNHNERHLRVKTSVKAGFKILNHNETQLRTRGLRVQTGIKAGPMPMDEGRKGGGQ